MGGSLEADLRLVLEIKLIELLTAQAVESCHIANH